MRRLIYCWFLGPLPCKPSEWPCCAVFGYFYSWLMLPFAVVTQRLLAGKGATILRWSLPAMALLALGLPFPRGAQLYGNTFFATLLLFVGLSIEFLRFKRTRNASFLRSMDGEFSR